MATENLVANLLRSIADLIEAKVEADRPAVDSVYDLPTDTHYVPDPSEPPPSSEGGGADEAEEGEPLPKASKERVCGVCEYGKRGRHIKECPRSSGSVVDRQAVQDDADEAIGEEEAPDDLDEPNHVLERIKAAEVRHQCCGSRGPMHKRACPGITPRLPDGGSAETANPDLKEFTCDDCGETFLTDPEDARCKCGSNNIWPKY